MRLFFVYVLFICTEYIPRTFIEDYKYHTVSLFQEFTPVTIAVVMTTILQIKSLRKERFTRIHFKTCGIAIAGITTASIILFFQWYWIIAPEYRDVPGDMGQATGWAILFIITKAIWIMLLYFMTIPITQLLLGKSSNIS